MNELATRIRALPWSVRLEVVRLLNGDPEREMLNVRQQIAADEYAVRCEGSDTSYKDIDKQLAKPEFKSEVSKLVDQHSEASGLTAKYLREYVKDALELDPLEYFDVLEGGELVISAEKLMRMPKLLRRTLVVEAHDARHYAGKLVYRVTFLDKATALSMAAKLAGVEDKVAHRVEFPWDVLGGDVCEEEQIEARIAAICPADPRPLPSEGAAVA